MVLATSEQEAANLSRFVPREKITTIPLNLTGDHWPAYVEARQNLGWSPDELVLLYLSRIHPKKGLHLLLRALCAEAKSLPVKWRLVIVGDGYRHYITECKDLASTHQNVCEHIEWKEPIWNEQKYAFFQGADLFCLPSFSENFGLAILEASQVGTRVLTSPYTPWGFLADWGGAFIVEPKLESIRDGLMHFLNSKPWGIENREHLAKRIHEQFSSATIGGQYAEMYRRLMKEPVSSSPVKLLNETSKIVS